MSRVPGIPPEKRVAPEEAQAPADKTALLVVDMQNDFCLPDGRHYAGDMAQRVIPKIKALLDQARNLNMRIIHTQSWYERDDPRFSRHPRAAGRDNAGCMAGTWGAEIIEELKPREGETVIRKASFDPFFRTGFDDALRGMAFGTFSSPSVHVNRSTNDCAVLVTGVVTNVCVEKAVIGLYNRGYEVIVPEDCVGAKDAFDQAWALYQFKRSYKAKITSSGLLSLSLKCDGIAQRIGTS